MDEGEEEDVKEEKDGKESKEGKDGKENKGTKKRIVLIMARQHPGESPASYVVQGPCKK